MSICGTGEKTTLYYRFNKQITDSTITFNDSVASISTSSASGGTGNFNAKGYRLTWVGAGGYFAGDQIVYDYYVTPAQDASNFPQMHVKQCGQTTFKDVGPVDANTIRIDNTVHCENTSNENASPQICTINVALDNGGKWNQSGECPAQYHTSCGEACPDGYIKCLKQSYPGYCCVACEPIENALDSLIVEVKNINHG